MRGGGRLVVVRCVESQFVTEGLLFAAVGEPVVHSDLGYQVGSQASKLGGRYPPLETLRPKGGRTYNILLYIMKAVCLVEAYVCSWGPVLPEIYIPRVLCSLTAKL